MAADEKRDEAMAVTAVLHLPGLGEAGETRTIPTMIAALPMMTSLPEVPGFQILSEVGRGGMGVVYMARQTKLNRTVALKMVLVGPTADPTTLQRFLFEAEVLARIQHPNVVQVYEVGTYRIYTGAAIPFLAMEYLDGGTLHSHLRKVGLHEPRAAAELIEGLARAVHAIHSQGVIHRDLKPANILRGDDGTFKVSDFGLAKLTTGGNSELTATGTIVGTPAYMSPEQASGSRIIGTGTDVYSLGAILYELLAGQPPYPGADQVSVLLRIVQHDPPNVRSLKPKTPINLAAIAMQALARNPAHRYASAEAMADDLRRFLEDRPTVARPATSLERVGLWVRRNPAVAALVSGLGAVTLFGMALVFGLWSRAESIASSERLAKDEARVAQGRAEAEREQAVLSEAAKEAALEKEKQSLRNAGRREARLLFYDAASWCDQGEPKRGFDGFGACIALARIHGDSELERVARASLKAWEAETIPLANSIPSATGSHSVAYSADGTLLAVGSAKSLMQVHDAATGRLLATCTLNFLHFSDSIGDAGRSLTCRFWTVAINADKTLLAAGASDGRVWLWKLPVLTAGKQPVIVKTTDAWKEGKSEDVWSVAFDRSGYLCTGSGDGFVRRWDIANPAKRKPVDELPPLADFSASSRDVQALIPSRDGRWIYTGDRTGRIREWNLLTKDHRIISTSKSWVQDLAISSSGSTLAAAVADGTIRLLDLTRDVRPQVAEYSLDGSQANTLDFSADGHFLAVGSGEGNVRIWDLNTELTVGFPIRDGGDTRKIRFRPGTDAFAVATGGAVRLYDLPDRQPRKVPLPATKRESPIDGITSLAFDPDGKQLLATHRHEPMLVDLAGSAVRTATFEGYASFAAATFGSNRDRGTIFAAADGKLVTFDSALQKRSAVTIDAFRQIRSPWLVYEPHRGLAVVAYQERIWSYRPNEKKLTVVHEIKGLAKVSALSANPVKPEIAFAIGRKVYFYNTANEALESVIREAEDDVFAAAYSPDGKRLLLGVRNNAAEVRELATWKSLFELSHKGAVVAVGWNGNGSIMVTGSRDKTVGVWDAITGLPLGPRLRHPEPITAIAYCPTDEIVAAACKSRRSSIASLFLWPLPEAKGP